MASHPPKLERICIVARTDRQETTQRQPAAVHREGGGQREKQMHDDNPYFHAFVFVTVAALVLMAVMFFQGRSRSVQAEAPCQYGMCEARR
jgi:hypothetical protein